MKNRKPKPKVRCRVGIATEEEYNERLNALISLNTNRLLISPRLIAQELLPMTPHGLLPQFIDLNDSSMYRSARPKGQREAARRLRQASARGR